MANPFDQAFRDLQADNAQQDGGENPFDAAFAGLGPEAPADLGPRTAGTIAADTWAQFGAGANRMVSGMSRLAGAATQPTPENLGLADRVRFGVSTTGGALMDAFAGVMGLAEQAIPFNRAAGGMGMGFSAAAGGAADELGLRAAEIEAREAEAAQASGSRTLQQRREANVFNQLAEALSGYQAGYEEQLSPQAQARAQERAGAMESGPMELLQFLLTNPSHALEVGVESLPTIVPGAALARGARALGAGQTAAQRLGEAGTVSTMTGASAGNVYQGVMELPDDQLQQLPGYADLASELGPEGAREALARQGMQAAIAFGAPVDAATVGLASRLGLNVVEQAAAGRGRLGSTALGALSGAGREAAGEFPQGVGQQIAENVGQAAAGQRDRSNLTEGALEAGILEAFASLGPGAAFGAGSATSGEQARRARDTQDDAEVDAVLREQVAQLERDAQRMPPTRRTQMADAISQALAGESAPLQGSAESQADESDSLQQRNDDETAGSPSALSDVAEQVDARLAELEDQAAANERTPEQMRALRAERDQLRDLLREVEASEGVIPADPAGRMSSEERAAATDRMAEITAELEAAGAASAFRREADRIRERLDRTDTDGEFLAAAKSLGFRPRQAAPRAPAPAPQRAEAPQPAAPTSSPAAAAFAGETEGAGTGSREDLISRWRAARTPRERADAAAALAAFNQQETRDGQAEAEEGAVPQGRQAQPDTGAEQPGPVSSRWQADSAPPAPGRARVTGDDRARRTAIGREIERVVSGLEDAPGVQFHVDTSTIPGEIASRAEAAGGIDSGVEAFYDPATDTIHAVIGNITGGRRRGGWVAEHEVGHVLLRSYAMRGDNDLRTIVERAAQNDAVAQVLRAMADQRPETDSLLQEEALVELMTAVRTGNYGEIKSRYGVTVPQAMRDNLVGAMRRVLQRIRTWLANHGTASAPTMSDAEVFDIMQRAFAEGRVAERANRGGTRAGRRRRAGGDDVVAQRAFHGTPQREIDAFSLNRIGTGEGNQAFGWGLYFASRRDVADAYRGALTGVNRRPGGRLADESIQRRGSRAEAIRELTALRDRAATAARRTEYQQAIDFIRSGVNRGQTYAVEVPENDVLLDYDAPLSRQPQAVQDAVRALEADGSIAPGTLDSDPSGAVIYSALGEPQEASRLLREAGIPGLRYLDGGSRASGDGTHNFVIWDEALIGAPEPLVASRRDSQTETPAFKRWFGDSKVVDANGEPLLVYHGTSAIFDVFDIGRLSSRNEGPGFYFTTSEDVARGYVNRTSGDGRLIKAYLSIKNPMAYDAAPFSPRTLRDLVKRIAEIENDAEGGDIRDGFLANFGDTYTNGIDGAAREAANLIAQDDSAVDQISGIVGSGVSAEHVLRAVIEVTGHDGIVSRGFSNEGDESNTIYVAFRPEQIKSATENRGTFDPADPSIVASRAPTFYSAALRAVEQGRGAPRRADAAAWKGWLDGAVRRGEMRQSERDWLGIDDWLDRQPGAVTREQLAEFVRANEVQVRDVVLGQIDDGLPDGWSVVENEDGDGFEVLDAQGIMRGEGETEADAIEDAQDRDERASSDVKFASYRLPGGENYRELLLTLPLAERDGFADYLAAYRERFPNATTTDGEVREFHSRGLVIPDDGRTVARRQSESPAFMSSHWEQPNVLAHIRFDERTDAEGRRVLFINELQSDWHQAGRKRGYGESIDVRRDRNGMFRAYNADGSQIELRVDGEVFQALDSEQAVRAAIPASFRQQGVPDAPFKSTDEWSMLAFKRAARWAVDNGFDRIAWVTGEQAADMFDLSKTVSRVTYMERAERLTAEDLSGFRVIDRSDIKPEDLAEYVGKEVAEKLMASTPNNVGVRQLSGLELKVGGEGMRGFYDKILPAAVNRWAKRFGARVGDARVKTGSEINKFLPQQYDDEFGIDDSILDSRVPGLSFNTYEQAEARAAEMNGGGTRVHAIDITPAMREAVEGGQPLFSRRTPSEANMERAQLLSRLAAESYAAGPVVPIPTPGRFAPLDDRVDAMRIKLQDKMLSVRRAQERAARGAPRQPGITTATLDDAMNAYRLENLMHGRVQDRLRGLDAELLTPLMKQLRRTGRSVAQLEDYLLARHAEERNARIASINPAMQDAGAGITTQMARDILAGREAGPYSGKRLSADDIAILESAAQKVDRMVAATRDTLEEAGLISPELANALRSTYSYYVPLRGYKGQEDEVTSGRSSGTGGGVTPGRANVRRAGGRGDMNLAQDILGEVVGDMQRAVVQAEKSRVAQSFLRFAMANPMPDLFTIEPVDLEWKFSESTGEAYLGVVNRAEDMGTSLVVPHNGTMVRIRFEDQRLADAMLNLNLADMSWFVQNIGAINRWRSAVLTRWNPSFFFVNLLRDAQFGMVGIAAERGIATAAQAAANYAPAFAALVRDNYSRSGDSSVPDAQKTMADWAREYAEAGAKTGIVLSEEVTDLQRRLSESATKIMQLAAEGKPLRSARQSLIRYGGPIIETIENFNDASENAIRLSAYVAMRKQGTSIEQAAEYAKNLTINFNRKGESGSTLNAIYLFYNAAMQGAHAVFRVMRKPGVQAFLGGMAGLQYLAALAMMGDDDDDGITDWDAVPDYVKRTSLVIPLGHFTGDSQDYFALPMPYGFNVVPYAGGRLAQYAHSGSRPTDPSVTADLVASITESFSPIPLQDGYRSLFGDTIGFFMGMAMNEDDMGRPIARENPYAQYDVPKALDGNVTTPRAYHVTSQILAKLGGGDLERREAPVGYLDIAPEQIKEMVEFMAGGLGNIANKSARFYEQMSAGNLESAMDVIDATPIASRFIGKGKTHRAVADRYYGEMGELARGLDRLRDRVASDPDNAEQALEDLRREEPALEGIEFDRFRANTRSGGRRGEIRTSPDGSPRFQPMPGSAFESRREAEREVTDINRSIRRLRTPGMTNADVVDMLGQMPPRADLPASERPVLEALGLPQDFDAEAQAPNRVRQRAIRMLQDQRMRSQQDFLRDLEADRRRARE